MSASAARRRRSSQRRVELVRECRFKNSFIFKYSERPGTKGAELYPDDVPDEVKRRRNNELLAIQNAISEEDNQPFVGRTVEVLVEGPSKAAGETRRRRPLLQLTGPNARATGSSSSTGTGGRSAQLLDIAIYDANAFTLFGQVVTQHVGPEVPRSRLGLTNRSSLAIGTFELNRRPPTAW